MNRILRIFASVLILVLFAMVWPSPASAADPNDVAIIANKSNPSDSITVEESRKIFLGDRSTWANGKKVVVVMRTAGTPERNAVLKTVYKMNDADYSKYFLQAAFTGKIQAPPKEVASAADMVHYVAQIPGAVGYVRAGEVDASVKVVLTIH